MQYYLAKDFIKKFKKLPQKTKNKLIEQLSIFIADSLDVRLSNHALRGEWLGYRSITITGNIRALYKIEDKNVARFVTIGSHSQLYE